MALRRLIVWGVLVVAAATLAIVPPRAAAQAPPASPASQSALAVSPAIIEEVLVPGQPAAFSLQVSNVTNYPLPIKTMVRDFAAQQGDMKKTEQARLDASQWFSIREPDFILQPKQIHTVEGTITPPAGAVPGGRYATVYFQPLVPEEVLGPSTTYLTARVGVLAFLVVKGDLTYSAEYKKGLAAPGLVRRGPVDFNFSIKNTGSVHLLPGGKVIIRDWRGRTAATLPIPPGVILPGTSKDYTLQWKNPGLPGKYTAELVAAYGSEHTPLPKSAVPLWVLPWVEMLAAIVLLAAGVFVARRVRKRWRRAWRAYRG